MTITEATSAEDLSYIATLFRAYNDFLTTQGISVCQSGLDKEIASLPGPYATGTLLLAKNDAGEAIGCVAMKQRTMPSGNTALELKRLYISPAARGLGAAKALMRACEEWARSHGFRSILLDTEPNKMPEAVRLYETLGYARIPAFNDNPVPNIEYFELSL